MSDDIEAILSRVAAGELTPEQALPLIDAAKASTETAGSADAAGSSEAGSSEAGSSEAGSSEAGSSEAGSAGSPHWGTPPSTPPGAPGAPENGPGDGPASETTATGRARAIRIAVNYRSVDVVGDASVDQVAVSGPHTVRREGDTLVVDSSQLPGFVEFEGGWPDSERGGAWSFKGLPRSVAWARSMKGGHMTIRVNPTLPITIDAGGAAVRVSGCEAGAKIRLVAASLKLDRVRGPLEIDALTSSVKGAAMITGDSRISGESSSVKLIVLPGSDVRVSAGSNRMSKVLLPGTPVSGPDGQQESVLGDGSGRLVIDGVMCSIMLATDASGWRASA